MHARSKDSTLFESKRPLEVKIRYSFRDIRKSESDTVFFPATLQYKSANGNWDSIPVTLRGRGNFRRKSCLFTPIRLKIKKKDAEGTIFSNDRSLKLVLPCQNSKSYDQYIYREYLCYKIYETITPYHFKTRILEIDLTDQNGSKTKPYSVSGFFIEDDDKVAKRFGGKIVDNVRIHPLQFYDTLSTQHDFFQFLIANTDWSAYASHNVTIMVINGTKFVPIAYDFDMAGIVNTNYATVNENLEIKTVTERLYRGYCRNESLFENVRQFYLNKETAIKKVMENNAQYLEPKEYQVIYRFIDEFFSILKNDRRFKSSISLACLHK